MERNWAFFTFTFGLAIGLALVPLGSVLGRSLQNNASPALSTLTVTATGTLHLEPELAWVHVGVHTEAEKAGDAVAQNARISSQVVQAVHNLGIDPKDVRTVTYNVWPREERDREGRLLRRYFVVEEAWRITVRDPAQVGRVLDAVLQAGANRVYEVRFGIEDVQAAQQQARALAVENARKQAEAIARAAGVTLVRIQSIDFGGAPRPVPVLKAAPAAERGGSVPISPGTLEVSATVTMVFEIRQ